MVDCLGWAPLEVLVMLTFMGLLHQTSCVNNNIGKRVLCVGRHTRTDYSDMVACPRTQLGLPRTLLIRFAGTRT